MTKDRRVCAMPAARRVEKERGVNLSAIVPAAADGIIRVSDVESFAAHAAQTNPPEKPIAMPAVRRFALDSGVELSSVTPSAPDGVIVRADIERAISEKKAAPATAPAGKCIRATPLARTLAAERGISLENVAPADRIRIYASDVDAAADATVDIMPRESRRERIRGMRKAVAEHMKHSYFLYPAVTMTTDADMKELLAFRTEYNRQHAAEGVKATVTDVLVAIVAKTLREFEIVNASIDGEDIVYHADVNVGIAVAQEKGGLLVPVLRHADELQLDEVSRRAKELVTGARANTLEQDAMKGGTFTVTNMGMNGIDAFTPIINFPESAILGVGRTVEKPVVINGMIAIRPITTLSLTHDHRLVDGAPAAEFLRTIVKYIERPNLVFRGEK